jgi:hypothetical protein
MARRTKTGAALHTCGTLTSPLLAVRQHLTTYVDYLWQAARNLDQLNESVKSRHEQITKGLYATRIPGLESVPSNHLMLGHAANPTGTKMRPADKFRKRRSASAMQ